MASVSELKATITADTSQAERAFERFADKAEDSAHRADGAGRSIANVGSIIATGLAAAAVGIGAALGASVNEAANFEKTLSGITAVMDKTSATFDQDVQSIHDKALQLGKDTAFSAGEAAKGMEELVKGGVSVEDIMSGAAEATLNLAAAGGTSLTTAAEITANSLAMFALKGSDAAHAADLIAGAANASSISVEDFKFSLAAGGAVAKAVGMSFDDFTAIIAQMGRVGIKGSDAGTSMKSMLMSLANPTAKASELMHNLGLEFWDASGNIKSGAEMAGIMKQQLGHLSRQEQVNILAKIFGADGVRAALTMLDAGAEGIEKIHEEMGKVTAKDVADTRLNNLKGDLDMLQGSLQTIAITVGEKFLPLTRQGVQAATAFLNGILEWNGLTAILDVVTGGFSRMISGVQSLAGVLTSTGGDRAGFFAALGLSPAAAQAAGALLDAIQLRVLAFIGIFTSTGGDRAGFFERLGFSTEAANRLGAIFDAVQGYVQDFGMQLSTVAQNIMDLFSGDLSLGNFVRLMQSAFTDMGADISGLTTLIGQAVGTVVAFVVDQAVAFAQAALAWGRALVEWVAPQIPALLTQLGGMRDSFVGWIWDQASTIATALLAWGTEFVRWVTPQVPALLNQLRDMAGAVLGWIGEQASAYANQLGEWGQVFLEWVDEHIAPLIDALGGLASAVLGWIGEQAGPFLAQLAAWGQAFIDWVVPQIEPMLAALGQLAVAAVEWVASQIPTIVSTLEQWGEAFVAWVAPRIGPLLSALVELLAQMNAWIIGVALPAIVQQLTQWGLAFVEWIVPRIPELLGKLVELNAAVVGWIAAQTPGVAAQLEQWGEAFVAWVAPAASRMMSELGALGGQIVGVLGQIAGQVGPAALAIGVAIVDGMSGGIASKVGSVISAAQNLANAAIDAAKGALRSQSPSLEFYDIGSDVVEGFTQGIDKEKGGAVNSVVDWITSIIGAANEALQNAPSKVWEEIGRGTAQGYIMGVLGQQQQAIEAALTLVEASSRSFVGAITGPLGDLTTEQARKIRDVVEAAAKAEQKALEAVATAQAKAAEAIKAGTEAARNAAQQAAASADSAVNAAALATRKVQETVADVQAQMAKTAQKAAEDSAKAAQKVADDAEKAAKKAAQEAQKAIEDSVKAAKEALDDFKGVIKTAMPGITKAFADALDLSSVMLGELTKPATKSKVEQAGEELVKTFAKALNMTAADRAKFVNSWMPTGREPGLQKLLQTFADDVVKAASTALKTSMTADQIFSGHWDFLINKLTEPGAFLDKMVTEFDKAGKKAGGKLFDGVINTIKELNALGPINLDNLLPGGAGTDAGGTGGGSGPKPPGNGLASYQAMLASYQTMFAGMGGQDIIGYLSGKGLNPGELIGPYLQGLTDLATFQQKVAEWFSSIMASGLWSPATGWRPGVSGIDNPGSKDPAVNAGNPDTTYHAGDTSGNANAGLGSGLGSGGPGQIGNPGDRAVRLADGGIVNRPTYAMVGEGRQSEAVSPLSDLETFIDGAVERAMQRMGATVQSVTIPVYVGDREVDRVVYDAQRRALRRAY